MEGEGEVASLSSKLFVWCCGVGHVVFEACCVLISGQLETNLTGAGAVSTICGFSVSLSWNCVHRCPRFLVHVGCLAWLGTYWPNLEQGKVRGRERGREREGEPSTHQQLVASLSG